jgi:hypothetical protein
LIRARRPMLCCQIAFRLRDARLVSNAAMFMRLLASTAAATHNSKRSWPSARQRFMPRPRNRTEMRPSMPARKRWPCLKSLQRRSTPSTGHGFESPVFTKALHPPDRRTDADIKLFGRLPSGSSFFHEVDDARSQLTRIRSMHWPALRRINALDLHLRRVLGIPIHCGRDVL